MKNAIYPPDGFLFDTHTKVQAEFIGKIKGEGTENALLWLEPIKNGAELSKPEKLAFRWEENSAEYLFELSKDENFKDSRKIVCIDAGYEADNLEVGTKYFWRVNGGETHSFSTRDNGFRFINLDGALNVRDLGGNKIKQGLIYRGSDIDRKFPITEEGKKTFSDVMKIKTEIELRKEADGSRPSVVAGVRMKHLPYRPYEEAFEDENREGIRKIMEFLSIEGNYPVYMHCLGGADRTGTVALFLRALVGEDVDFIHTDYELTSLSSYAGGLAEGAAANGFRCRNYDYYKNFFDKLSEYAPNGTVTERVRAFLNECNVTNECMDKIISIIKSR